MSAPVVTQADYDAAQAYFAGTHGDQVAEGFARHRTATEAAFRAREAGLVEALDRIDRALGEFFKNTALCDAADDCLTAIIVAMDRTAVREALARAKATSEGGDG